MILAGDFLAPRQYCIYSFQLTDSQRATHFRQAVVVSELGMFKPVARVRPALIAQCPDLRGNARIFGNDGSAFARGDLLIGIESEDAGISPAADFPAVVFRANGLAGILNDAEMMLPSDFQDGREFRG